jgi:hypothetical protein
VILALVKLAEYIWWWMAHQDHAMSYLTVQPLHICEMIINQSLGIPSPSSVVFYLV